MRIRRRAVLGSVAVALGGAAIAAAFSQTPRLLRRLDTFRVTRVEVRGARYMIPRDALRASGVQASANVFDDLEPVRQRLLRSPLVADAEVSRRLPGTLVLTIRETEPVALVRDSVLRPIDARGVLLPIDPARVPLDLPILGIGVPAGSAGRLRAPAALALLATLDRIRRFEPDFAARISEAGPGPGGSVEVRFRDPADASALLPADPDPIRLHELVSTLGDLEARAELTRLRRIDGRFREQVVVSLNPKAS